MKLEKKAEKKKEDEAKIQARLRKEKIQAEAERRET